MQPEEFPKDLPAKYYHSYFNQLITFVRQQYESILNTDELAFLNRYQALSEDAQCLFIRFSNRRRAYFRSGQIHYDELNDIPASLHELLESGFISELQADQADRLAEILELFTKPELLQVAKALEPEVMPIKSIKKADLVRWLNHEYDFSVLCSRLQDQEVIVKVNYELEFDLMKFLFFGNRYADMSEFIVRDLGHVRYESYDDQQYVVRFQSRKEMEDSLMVSLIKETFYTVQSEWLPEEIYDWFMNWYSGVTSDLSPKARPSLNRFITRFGAWLEKKKLPNQALVAYQLTDAVPSRERRVRLLNKLGEIDEALALCQEIGENPQNADERFFSQDYTEKMLKKKKRAIKSTTQALKMADYIELDEDFRHRVELGAITFFQQLGYDSFFSENEPWRNLFGLLFWDIIYDTNVQAIHNPLQRIPSDFFLPDFYIKREAKLLQKKNEIQDKQLLIDSVSNTYRQKLGITNVMVSWNEGALERVLKVIEHLTLEQLFAVLFEMAVNLRENTRGFPDILISKGTEYAFLEVKSPTDHLSAQQLHWQRFFEKHQISSRIVRIRWQNTERTTADLQ
ncbi:VRR-NUC domain-containing protein [Dyadobacter jejuensis]|uniref:phosphodiesterase I n=1 Tax=Dyadobacter jejuensis TaxID=1082580 RepID=A0A316AZF2_9BACT|nr:VRR-NUC domain-containing protein [Dyadobacter jejuensis]PWJ55617.1 VRR-NUC domain-containing protein [Dyadobacter jejuensis]